MEYGSLIISSLNGSTSTWGTWAATVSMGCPSSGMTDYTARKLIDQLTSASWISLTCCHCTNPALPSRRLSLAGRLGTDLFEIARPQALTLQLAGRRARQVVEHTHGG